MIDEVLRRFDWTVLRSFEDTSASIPGDLRRLASASSEIEAAEAHRRIWSTALSDDTPTEAAVAVADCLVRLLPDMSPAGRAAALNLLFLVGNAEAGGPEHDQLGEIDMEACRRTIAEGFDLYVDRLVRSPSPDEKEDCILLIVMSATADRARVVAAEQALLAARNDPMLDDAGEFIANGIADVRDAWPG